MGSQLAGSVLVLVSGLTVARALGPVGKGFHDVVVNSATLLTTFTGLSIGSGIFFYASRQGVEAWALLRFVGVGTAATVALVLVALTAAPAAPFVGWLLPRSTGAEVAPLLVALLLGAMHLQQAGQAMAKGLGHYRDFAISELVIRGGTVVGVVGLFAAGIRDPAPYVGVLLAAVLLASLLLFAREAARAGPRRSPLPLRAIVRYSLPLFVGNAVQFLNYKLDVYFVNGWLGLRAVGTYTLAVWLSQMLWLLPNAVGALVLQAAARADRPEAALDELCRLNRLCLALTVLGATALAGGAAAFVGPAVGHEFRAAVRPLVVLLPGVVAFTTAILLSAFLNGMRRQHYTTLIAFASLAVTVAADVVLIPRLGIAGAAAASTLSYATTTLLTVLVVRRTVPALSVRALLVPQSADVAAVRYVLGHVVGRVRRGLRVS